MNLYSFKSVSGYFTHPLAGFFMFYGQLGVKTIGISMATEKTQHDVSADGNVMVSYIAGDNGTITITCQQTSAMHAFLLAWYNACNIAAQLGDPTEWAAGMLTIRSITDFSGHVAIGVSPGKLGDKPYAAQGQDVTWTLWASNIQNM